jgi:NADH-quinone oxidoreductase subunit J
MNPTIENSTTFAVVWWAVAAMTLIAATFVVRSRDILRAALALVGVFIGVVVLFFMLNAELLALVQLLIYGGAVSVLIIFAVLLTRDVAEGSPSNRLQVPALLVSGAFVAVVVFVITDTPWNLLKDAPLSAPAQQAAAEVYANSTPWLAGLLMRDFVLPFEVAGALLLATVIGALALLRERQP